jgi:hypothetical protein
LYWNRYLDIFFNDLMPLVITLVRWISQSFLYVFLLIWRDACFRRYITHYDTNPSRIFISSNIINSTDFFVNILRSRWENLKDKFLNSWIFETQKERLGIGKVSSRNRE